MRWVCVCWEAHEVGVPLPRGSWGECASAEGLSSWGGWVSTEGKSPWGVHLPRIVWRRGVRFVWMVHCSILYYTHLLTQIQWLSAWSLVCLQLHPALFWREWYQCSLWPQSSQWFVPFWCSRTSLPWWHRQQSSSSHTHWTSCMAVIVTIAQSIVCRWWTMSCSRILLLWQPVVPPTRSFPPSSGLTQSGPDPKVIQMSSSFSQSTLTLTTSLLLMYSCEIQEPKDETCASVSCSLLYCVQWFLHGINQV